MFLIKCLLNKDLSYLLYCKDIVKPIYQGHSKTYKTKDIVKPIITKKKHLFITSVRRCFTK